MCVECKLRMLAINQIDNTNDPNKSSHGPLHEHFRSLKDQDISISTNDRLSQFFQKPLSIVQDSSSSIYSELPTTSLGVPKELQIYSTIHELIFNLLGISGDNVTITTSGYSISNSCTYDTATKEILGKILPLGSYYSRLGHFASSLDTKSFTLRSIKSALRWILRDYEDLIVSLEQQFRSDDLTIQKIFYYIQSPLEIFHHLCKNILDDNLHGCRLVLHLSKLVELNKTHSLLCPIYEFLLEASIGPIIYITDRFTMDGILYDPYHEYFIESCDNLKKEDMEEDYNATYWSEKYSIKESIIPSFFSNSITSKILLTGKYISSLMDCQIFPFKDIKKLDEHYSLKNIPSYISAIEERYQKANQSILDLLMTKYDLMGHLVSIKRTFFMQYGDTYCHFLDLSEQDLALPADQTSIEKLQSYFDHCISDGTSKNDSYISNTRLELSSYSFADQLTKIVKMSGDDAVTSKHDTVLSGLIALTLTCHYPFPLSIVLSMKSITKYAMLFRHLLSCRSTQRQLDRTLLPTDIPNIRLLLQRMDIFSASAGRLYHLKMKMSFFIRVISGYLFWDVLEHNWLKFERESQSSNIDDIISLHSIFLDSCLKECLLTNWKLFRIVSKLFTTCQLFVSLCKKIGKELSSIPIDEMDGLYLKSQQVSIYKQLAKIDTNFSFHIKLLVHSLQFFSATDYDHRIAGLIFQLENAFPDVMS